MSDTFRSRAGFTIVELLIVIVVIAILATISIVAYNGMQGRAYDTAVQSDINGLAKKIALYKAEFDSYPAGGNTSIPGIGGKFTLSRGSYSTAVHNFFYCTGDVSGSPAFAVGATSRSGNRYYFSSLIGGVQSYTGSWGGNANVCPGMLPGMASWTYAYAYDLVGGWRPFFN